MPLIPITLPAGQYRNGTDFQASNRWRDASLVRWIDGTMRPVGGWRLRTTVGADPVRAAVSWTDLSGDRRFAAATFDTLTATLASNVTSDITPVDLVAGTADAAVNTGYGGGTYGTGFYGVARPDPGNFSKATTWSLDNWGEYLVACSVADGRLFEWQLDAGTPAQVIANAPTDNVGLLVTEERFLFALGAGGNPRKLQWCDREDNTQWAPLPENEAGDFELQTGGQIMLGLRTRGQSLVITDHDAHSVSYQGPPFVYAIQRVGSACGAISRRSAVAIDSGALWMGTRDFHYYGGGSVEDIPCEVADYVFGSMNGDQISKVFGVANQGANEVWWFYPSAGSLENDRYVAYNYAERHWMTGSLARTAGIDAGSLRYPLWFCNTGCAYDHEVGFTYGGAAPFAETGPISLGAGDQVACVTQLVPDEKTQGDVTASFKTRFHPNDVERAYGPYSMANPTSVRLTGRQVRMRVDGASASDWRVGTMRVDVTPGGRR